MATTYSYHVQSFDLFEYGRQLINDKLIVCASIKNDVLYVIPNVKHTRPSFFLRYSFDT